MDYQVRTPQDHPDRERLEKVVNHLLNFIDADAVYVSYSIKDGKPQTVITTVLSKDSDVDADMMDDTKVKKLNPDFVFRFYETNWMKYAFKKGKTFFILHCSFEELTYLEEGGKVFLPTIDISKKWFGKVEKRYAIDVLEIETLYKEYSSLADDDCFKSAIILHQLFRVIYTSVSKFTEGFIIGDISLLEQYQWVEELVPSFKDIIDINRPEDKEILERLTVVGYANRANKPVEISKDLLDRAFMKADLLKNELHKLYKECKVAYLDKFTRLVNHSFLGNRIFSEAVSSNYLIDSALSKISNEITDFMKTRVLFCFGYKMITPEKIKRNKKNFYSTAPRYHFYLLLYYREYKDDAVQNILARVYTKFGQHYRITLLLHNYKNLRNRGDNQRYFLSKISNNGLLLYNHPFCGVYNDTFANHRDYESSTINWENRSYGAITYLELATKCKTSDEALIKDSLLHNATVQIALGLLSVFLGYQPNQFSIVFLFSLLEYLTTVDFVYDFKTEKEKQLFQLLAANPDMLKFKKLKIGNIEDSNRLQEMCNVFYKQAQLLADCELQRQGILNIEDHEAQ